jgi:exodeoxyribonuclease-5
MKNPNKTRNVSKTLLTELAAKTNLSVEQVLDLHKRCMPSPERFSSCMSYLWRDQDSIQRVKVLKNAEAKPAPLDRRFFVLYLLIQEFVVGDPRNFWAENVSTAPVRQICAVCSENMTQTDSGLVCPNGHGGSEIDVDSDHQIEEIFGVAKPEKVTFITDRPNIPWNDQQSKAFKKVFAWLGSSRSSQQVFKLLGYAGSGKTTAAREIAAAVEAGENGIRRGTVLFAAYTGKAASVMMKAGCAGASTIHSLIYRAKVDPLTGSISGFSRNEESPLKYARLLILDEVSMVDEDMARDLLSFGVQILVLGDPKQLRPIKGYGYFTQGEADVMLTTIERVAAENPLIWLATEIRNERMPKPGRYGDSRIFKPGRAMRDEDIAGADQLIVGMNRTRHALNKRYRMLSGAYDVDTEFPIKGERLMCLKNNKQTGLLNGTQWICSTPVTKQIQKLKDPKRPAKGSEPTNIEGLFFRVLGLDLYDSEGNGLILNTSCSTHHFDRNLPEPPWRDIAGTDEYDFAFAGTVHKMQGSQFPFVAGIDESHVFQDQRWEHLYTMLTRASERFHLYQPE